MKRTKLRTAPAGIALGVFLASGLPPVAVGSDLDFRSLDRRFTETVRPFVKTYCTECHGPTRPKGKLDLSAYARAEDIVRGHETWELVLERIEAGEMPPEKADRRPSPEARRLVVEWIRDVRTLAAQLNEGDPGDVPVRRLSNAEYDYSIRDLTGVDIRPTRAFPVDPANEAGFDNSGESLTMSPALLEKYLGAAREVAEHLVLAPDGITFAPHPVVAATDRDKYCVRRIVEFYRRQPTDYADYFLAAWRFEHRGALGQPDATLEELAAASGLSGKYLAYVWSGLIAGPEVVGPMATLQTMWRELPSGAGQLDAARAGCERMRDFVVRLRRKLEPGFDDLSIAGIHKGSQTFVLWKNDQYAARRRMCNRDALRVEGEPRPEDERERKGRDRGERASGDNEKKEDEEDQGSPELVVPADEAQRVLYEASFDRFCALFPDRFYVSERGRDYVGKPREQQEKGRLLSAGFHSMMGYYRDDAPLYELILDEDDRRELDALWLELDFITSAPMRQYTGFVWFERTDSRYMRDPRFDFARAEDKNVTSEAMIRRLSEVYLEKALASGGEGAAIKAIEDYFRNINAAIRRVERSRLAAEPAHIEGLLDFARRACRRPLSPAERADLISFYRSLRDHAGLDHEDALKDTLVSVLVSPHFCYRVDLVASARETRSLTDTELASRLSYFLWSSLPDEPLMARASAGDLHRPDVLVAQTRRMLADDRVRGLAREFCGHWLDFRRFEEHNSVDRERSPSFTNELRQAMFEEPVRFFVDMIQTGRPILDLLYASDTLVNPVLAEHYGIPDLDFDADGWTRVGDADRYGRGGLLSMSVFLTMNAPGLRTSPVKRGYWVVRRLLGERIPAPPPNVPELPDDETKLGDLTLRETLARHRESRSCAGCHDRFDSIGLAFEGFGPIGERRDRDLGGRPVDTAATFPGGVRGDGLEGLRDYLRKHRQEEFLANFCRKLLSYALGRSLALSDEELVGRMRKSLRDSDDRFSSLVETIVTSRQFLNKRGRASPTGESER